MIMSVAAIVPAVLSAVGAVAGAAMTARTMKKAGEAQAQPVEQQAPQDPKPAERQSRRVADVGMALSTRNARRSGAAPSFRGTLLTGPQGIADQALSIGKTMLGQ